MDKQRVVSNLLKSGMFPKDLTQRLTMVIKDINSLFEYIRFGFDRLDYLQDTFLGLVNLQQNKIIKIFNPEKSFTQTEIIEKCTYCDFKALCKR
jgi:magnesium transporter